MGGVTLCRRRKGGRGCGPAVKKLGGGRPPRFENEVAQVRCLIRFLGYFSGRLATLPTIRPRTQKSVATPLGHTIVCGPSFSMHYIRTIRQANLFSIEWFLSQVAATSCC